jgi:riboflavin biosynthesis pyrimidine reductase
MEPFDVIYQKDGLTSRDLTTQLGRLYGGDLGFKSPRLYANFVSSLDGVVAIEGVDQSSQMISGNSQPDRFVMGLLRAFADAVLIGAETMRAAPDSLWTPGYIFPDCASDFSKLRDRLERDAEPRLVVLTSSGALDPRHPALEAGALVVTTEAGSAKLGTRLPLSSNVVTIGDAEDVDLTSVISVLHGEGHEVVLTEGGPTVIGGLLRRRLLDELFLTVSPLLAGRSSTSGRPGLVEGIDLLPERTVSSELLSARRHGSHLFLRYEISRRPGM